MPPNLKKLEDLAATQYGYFLATQAKSCGYSDELHVYHTRVGNWTRIERGVFRLGGFKDSLYSEFTKWTLWSRTADGLLHAVVSHKSALFFYGLLKMTSEPIHLTVPMGFRKKMVSGCVLHKATVRLSEVKEYGIFRVTALFRTLQDMRSDLYHTKQWEHIIQNACLANLLTLNEMHSLVGEFDPKQKVEQDEKITVNIRNGGSNMNVRWKSIRQRSTSAFTLVELLVVMSIISILSAILLPSLQKAMASAKAVACTSNQKQLYFAFQAYTSDFDGYFSPYLFPDISPTKRWMEYFLEQQYFPSSTLLVCPSREASFHRGYLKKGSINPWHLEYMDYGYNIYYIGSNGGNAFRDQPASFSKIRKIGKTLLLTDTRCAFSSKETEGYCYFERQFAATDFTGVIFGVHASSVNTLWCDGHISAQFVCDPYNPYLDTPFTKGTILHDTENHFDRY